MAHFAFVAHHSYRHHHPQVARALFQPPKHTKPSASALKHGVIQPLPGRITGHLLVVRPDGGPVVLAAAGVDVDLGDGAPPLPLPEVAARPEQHQGEESEVGLEEGLDAFVDAVLDANVELRDKRCQVSDESGRLCV